MSDEQVRALRFKPIFTWGGVVIALLGLFLVVRGATLMGLLLIAAGIIAALFAKRRTRRAGG